MIKYLLDENIRYEDYKCWNPPLTGNFFRITDVLYRGVPDRIILKYAKKHKMVIVTRDLMFARKLAQRKMKFILMVGKLHQPHEYYMKMTRIPRSKRDKIDEFAKYRDPVTRYLQKTKTIMLP